MKAIVNLLRKIRDAVRIVHCAVCHRLVLRRIRAYPKGRKIRVLFVCSNSSKWKNQSVYKAMENSDAFDPYVVLTHPSDWVDVSEKRLVEMMDELKSFFLSLTQKMVDVDFRASRRYRPSKYLCENWRSLLSAHFMLLKLDPNKSLTHEFFFGANVVWFFMRRALVVLGLGFLLKSLA